ncbi:uncharacterized protein LOC143820996 [Paroedura picta]|uniref:uncharacterized protein LOC143820996 n=1 Tax=Paroedura picta TaxID=143630 RepID=UPI0040565F5E
MFTKLLARLLALHWIMFIPGRSCDFWKELHGNSCTLYHSMQVVGERLENHLRTIDLLLQEFSNTAGCWVDKHLEDIQNWVDEIMGALTTLVNDQAQSLEKHALDLSAWLNVNFGKLQEYQETYTRVYVYGLGTEIPAHDECSDRNTNQTDSWLDQPAYIPLDEPLGEDLLSFYDVPEMCASNISSSLEDCAHVHIQFLKDSVDVLEKLWDSCRMTISMLLVECRTAEEASYKKAIWDFFNTGPQAEEVERAIATTQQEKCSSVLKWLGKLAEFLE